MAVGPQRFQSSQQLAQMSVMGSTGGLPKTPAYGTTGSNGEIFSVRTHLQDLDVRYHHIKAWCRVNLLIY